MVCLSLRKREKNRNGTIYFYLTSWTTWNTFIASLRKQMTFWDATNATIQIWRVRDISIEISALVSHWRHFAGKPLVGSQNVVCFNFSGSYFSMQCIMYWLIMNNRITLKKLMEKKKNQNWDVTKKRNRKRAWETGKWKKGKKWKNWWWRYW